MSPSTTLPLIYRAAMFFPNVRSFTRKASGLGTRSRHRRRCNAQTRGCSGRFNLPFSCASAFESRPLSIHLYSRSHLIYWMSTTFVPDRYDVAFSSEVSSVRVGRFRSYYYLVNDVAFSSEVSSVHVDRFRSSWMVAIGSGGLLLPC
jgi:hypothetical protein